MESEAELATPRSPQSGVGTRDLQLSKKVA